MGDELYVTVVRESRIKHKPKSIIPDKQRVEMVNSLKIVDKVILGSASDIFDPIKKIKPVIIVLRHDSIL